MSERSILTEHPAAGLIEEEMAARGWSLSRLAIEMGGDSEREIAIDQLAVEMLLACRQERAIRVGQSCAAKFGRAFGVGAQFFLNLDAAWERSTPTGGPRA